MKQKIGIGIITCNRENFFQKCINSIPDFDEIIVINDGRKYDNIIYPNHIKNIIQHRKNKGVGKSKNEAIEFLIKNGCTDIFLCEDDIIIRDPNVFEKYIYSSKETGILHFNSAFHGKSNKDENGKPLVRTIIRYNNLNISLNKYIVGAFSYYRNVVIEKVGLMNEAYYNGIEHIEHTLRIINAGFHPPYWWFADIENSFDYIIDQDISLENSSIRYTFKNKLHRRINSLIFLARYGHYPWNIPDVSFEEVLESLEKIKLNHS